MLRTPRGTKESFLEEVTFELGHEGHHGYFHVSRDMPCTVLGPGDRKINRRRCLPSGCWESSVLPSLQALPLPPPSPSSPAPIPLLPIVLGSPGSCRSEHLPEWARSSSLPRKWGAPSPELREERRMWAPPRPGRPGSEHQSHRASHSTHTPEKWS